MSRQPADFAIAGAPRIGRLGFGAMRITGAGVWGPPADPAEARRVLREVRRLGITLVDTADSYGPAVSEELIREVLYPYGDILVATKGGLERPGPGRWLPNGRPDYLRRCLEASLARLGVDRIELWQLHRIDPNVPRDAQFAVIRAMIDEGLIRHAGLSEVGVADIEAARGVFPVATVQNLYNLANRKAEPVLQYCERNGIGFIPWFPLAAGELAKPGGAVAVVAGRTGATPAQVALAWLLQHSPVMLPIPGTGSVRHLQENCAAARLVLTQQDIEALDAASRSPRAS